MPKNPYYRQPFWKAETAVIVQFVRKYASSHWEVHFTRHFRESMKDRALSKEEVLEPFLNGSAEMIQAHAPWTYQMPERNLNRDEVRVFYGTTSNGKIIHLVVALPSDGRIKFVTVYYPSLKYFHSDFKTLR